MSYHTRHKNLFLTVLITGCAGVFSIAFTQNGLRALSGRGVDWAHHLSLVDMFVRDGHRQLAIATGNLGEMATYPPFSHLICAIVSRIFSAFPSSVDSSVKHIFCVHRRYASGHSISSDI
jgi:hypothetical protein